MQESSKGKVIIKNVSAFLEWYSHISYQEAKETEQYIITKLGDKPPFSQEAISAARRQYGMTGLTSTFEARWPEHHKESVLLLETFLSYYNEGLEVRCGLWLDNQVAYIYMGNAHTGFVFREPERWLEFVPDPDFSDVSPAEFQALKLTTPNSHLTAGIIPADQMSLSQNDINKKLASKEEDISALTKEIKKVEMNESKELAEIKAKIEAMQQELRQKKEALLAELNSKMEEMEKQKETLENQIYLLHSQIFAIRCYAGETVTFIPLRTGVKAPATEPVVVHQKLRYLDEELGKLASLYEIQWSELGLFEEFLKNSSLALDTFAPNNRCIVLVRLSRTGKSLGMSSKPGYENMLEKYDYFHGKTVGIIIRNGENLYLGWTDDRYIKIEDNLVNNMVDLDGEEEPEQFVFESEKKAFQKRKKEHRRKAMSDILSRIFVSNILQGVVDNSDLLELPEGSRFDTETPYIKYALADTWLDDNRFGSFGEIIEKCNEHVSVGDTILSMQRLVPEHERAWGSGSWPGRDRPWENSRGRGDANRTHDCHVDDCKLYPVNLVEYDEPIQMVRYRFLRPDALENPAECEPNERWQYAETPEKYWVEPGEGENREFVLTYEKRNRHVFVSLEKEDNWRRGDVPYIRPPRANFEVYGEEFINLTYMNSVWLSWAITQKKLGNWRIGGQQVDYSYGIRYLKKALEFVRKREEEEKALLDAIDATICQNSEWPLRLSEWKIDKGVRRLTAFQAKRFAKNES